MNNNSTINSKLLTYLFLTLVILVAFMPSLHNSFVNFDDNVNIYENPYVININGWGVLLRNIKGMFSTHVIGNYNPLPILTFSIERIIFGFDNLQFWHLDNIFLHLVCVIFVFEIALLLGLEFLPAMFCSILFGIQPMRVESVAWLTERKDVLYGAFYLASLYYYIKYIKSDFDIKYMLIVTVLFLFSLFAKIQAVVLPLSMLAVDYYLDRKIEIKLIYEKAILFFMSLLFGVVGIYFLNIQHQLTPISYRPLLNRVFIGSYSYLVYLLKSIVPYEMLPLRPFPSSFDSIYYLYLIIAVVFLLSIVCFHKNKNKTVVFGLLFFTINIMFLLQIKVSGKAFLADRFTYIAYFGLFFIYSYLLQAILNKYKRFHNEIIAVMLIVLAAYGIVTYNQNKIWKNGETFWSRILHYYPNNLQALSGRGEYFSETGQLEKAIADYSSFLSQKPHQPVVYFRRGKAYLRKEDPQSLKLAISDFSMAIKYGSSDDLYLSYRGQAYMKLGMTDKAMEDYNKASSAWRQ